jgi:hypothetical protein
MQMTDRFVTASIAGAMFSVLAAMPAPAQTTSDPTAGVPQGAIVGGKHIQPRGSDLQSGGRSDTSSIQNVERMAPVGPSIVPRDIYGNPIGKPPEQEVPLNPRPR